MAIKQKVLFLNEPKGDFSIGLADIDEPGQGEVLVEVHSAALNPADWIVRELNILVKEYPAIAGCEAAGVVKKVGEGVTNVVVGDEVFFTCKSTLDSRKAAFKQYTIAEADFIMKKPSSLTFDQAASVPLTTGTAVVGLYGKKTGGGELLPPWEEGGRGKYAGQPIVVIGAGSNVGCHVVEFAKMSGFSPIIVTASKSKEVYLKSIGATHVIDRFVSPLDLPAAVKEITGEPPKIVYDVVAHEETVKAANDILAPDGKMIVLPSFVPANSKLMLDKEICIVNQGWSHPAQREIGLRLHSKLTDFLEAGDIKPSNIIEVLPGGLAGISAGLEKLKAGTSGTGNLKFVVHPQDTA